MTEDERRQDALLRELASRYVEQYGSELERERELLEQADSLPLGTPGLDRRVKRLTDTSWRRRYGRQTAIAAACLLLVLLAGPLLGRLGDGSAVESPSAAGDWEAAADGAAPAEAPHAAEEAETDVDEETAWELLPLSAELPEGFTISAVKQDRGQSIYYLEDAALDHAVVTLERAASVIEDTGDIGDPVIRPGLVEISIGGQTAYAASEADYNLLTFLKGDVVYTLTCRHDINTLVLLGDSILSRV